MEGPPNEIVQYRTLQCVKWEGYYRLLKEMYEIKHVHGHVYSEEAQRKVDIVSIKMFSMVEKLYISPVVDNKYAVRTMGAVLRDVSMCAYFRKHCLSVEVIRKSGDLECLFFARPILRISRERALKSRFDKKRPRQVSAD
eukprot:SAG22_NODE_12025_length_459_cov_1.077778_1_plen_140_part_10